MVQSPRGESILTMNHCESLKSVLAYLYSVTKYTKVLQLAIFMTQVRQKIARIHPIQTMKKGVQPHLQV
jgi:hypothetical protein